MPDVALPITPKVSDKVTAGALYAGNTAIIAAAPALNNINPEINPHNVGGIEVGLIGDGITTVIQALKQHGWYDQNRWAVWTCIVMSLSICILLWWVLSDHPDPVRAILNSFGGMYKAATNYGPLNKLGALAQGPDGVE